MATNAIDTSTCPACGPNGGANLLAGTVKTHPLMRCPTCGLQRLDPQPDDRTLTEIYQREYYDAWGIREDAESTRALKRATFASLLIGLPTQPGVTPKLLDCGAATGYLMEEAKALGMEPYGIELSEFGAARIAEKFGQSRVFRGPFDDAEFVGVDRDFFDVITMIDFIEHVRDPVATLAKAYTLLRPGGSLVVLTPNAGSLSRRLMGRRWLHYKIEHLFYFTKTSLQKSLSQVGFNGIRIGQAWKTMNLHYVAHQLSQYPHPLLSPIVTLLHRLGPPRLRKAMFRVSFGELLATAVKPVHAEGRS